MSSVFYFTSAIAYIAEVIFFDFTRLRINNILRCKMFLIEKEQT